MVWTVVDAIETIPIWIKVIVLVIAAGGLVAAITGMASIPEEGRKTLPSSPPPLRARPPASPPRGKRR